MDFGLTTIQSADGHISVEVEETETYQTLVSNLRGTLYYLIILDASSEMPSVQCKCKVPDFEEPMHGDDFLL